jgi:adenosylhomocysteine nucleosidase
MSREASCLGSDGIEFLCSGADPQGLRLALQHRRAENYAAVVSFGLAGGLCPTIRPGDAIIGSLVVADGGVILAHAQFSDALQRGLEDAGVKARLGPVAAVDAPAMTVGRKQELRQATQAIVVDMESHVAGAFARAHRLPFAMLRVASDPAERALPPLAARAIRPDGGVDLPFVLRELAREPRQLGDLIRAGVDSGAAFSTLRRCGRLLGPLFGLVLA